MMALVLAYGPWLVFLAAFVALLFTFDRWMPASRLGLALAGIAWVFLVQGDSLILGPRARLEWGDGDLLFMGYFPYLAQHTNSVFLHDLIGGTDRFAVGRIGGAVVSLRLGLLEFLPLWFVAVALRLITCATALLAVYLFATRRLGCGAKLALALGALFAASFDVTATMTFLYAISIAAIPMLLHLLVSLDRRPWPWLAYLSFSTVYVMLADPFYWLPVIWLICILILFWHRPNSYRAYLSGLLILTLLWLANYAEAIYAVMQVAPLSSRPDDFLLVPLGELVINHLRWMLAPSFEYNQGGWPFMIPLAFAALVALLTRSTAIGLAVAGVLVLGFASPFLIAVPWHDLGLDLFASYRWYLEYGSFALVMLAAAQAGAVLEQDEARAGGAWMRRLSAIMPVLCLAIALAMLTSFKLNTIAQMATRGNLSAMQDITNLQDPDWYTTEGRVVGVPTIYPRNASPSYGLASFDGGATFVPKSTYYYWTDLVLKHDAFVDWALPGLALRPEYLACCEPLAIDEEVSIDMLRVANVAYILSYRSLAAPGLTLVSGPAEQVEIGWFERIFSAAPEVMVYAIDDPLPLVYGASGVTVIADGPDDDPYLAAIRDQAPEGIAVLREADTQGIDLSSWTGGEPLVFHKVMEGFDIDIPPNAAGLILVNTPPFPWWQARTQDGAAIETRPANLNQLALAIPAGTTQVTLRYERPTLLGY